MNRPEEPVLAPPGAGLPPLELFIGRLLFSLRWRLGSRQAFETRFQQERQAIGRLITGLDDAAASERVLIRRVPGLEDSSRYWSVWMTLEHLRIVNHGIAGTIAKLSQGTVPEGQASTSAVKPSAEVTASVVRSFEKSCDAVLARVAAAGDLKTRLRYAHPWFGPLNAYQWFAMAGSHLGIHRVQIERIVRGYRAKADRS